MIWLDIKTLEQKINENKLTEKDGLNYLLANAIVTVIGMISYSNYENTGKWITFLAVVLHIVICIWGLNAAFKANNQKDGRDFVKRYLAISWVVSIRLLLIVLALTVGIGLFMGIVAATTGWMPFENPYRELFSTVISLFFSLLAYYLTVKSFKRLKTDTGAEQI